MTSPLQLTIVWGLSFMFLTQIKADAEKVLMISRQVRASIYADPATTMQTICASPNVETRWLPCKLVLSWRDQGAWTSVCHAQHPVFYPARFYRLEVSCGAFFDPMFSTHTILKR